MFANWLINWHVWIRKQVADVIREAIAGIIIVDGNLGEGSGSK